jgi:hypothetical protein
MVSSTRRIAFIIFSGRVSFDQSYKHPDDVLTPFFPGENLMWRQFCFGDQNVQTSGTFERRAMSDIEEPATILQGVLAFPSAIFSGIEFDARSN